MYAAALNQSGTCTFWEITALRDYIASGTDAANKFIKAPLTKNVFYAMTSSTFKSRYERILKVSSIKLGHTLPVCHASQGHMELPCILTKMIHDIRICCSLSFKNATYKTYLYQGIINKHSIFSLRQVDGFALVVPSTKIMIIFF